MLPALVLASVWAAGFEAAPLAHAILARGASSAHCHGAACHDHGDAAGILAAGASSGSLEHRDLAALTPLPVVLFWPVFVTGLLAFELARFALWGRRGLFVVRARGPPRARVTAMIFRAKDGLGRPGRGKGARPIPGGLTRERMA